MIHAKVPDLQVCSGSDIGSRVVFPHPTHESCRTPTAWPYVRWITVCMNHTHGESQFAWSKGEWNTRLMEVMRTMTQSFVIQCMRSCVHGRQRTHESLRSMNQRLHERMYTHEAMQSMAVSNRMKTKHASNAWMSVIKWKDASSESHATAEDHAWNEKLYFLTRK